MKNSSIIKLFLGFALWAPLFAACSDEDNVLPQEDPKPLEKPYYIAINIELPETPSSRSTTNDGGTTDKEVPALTNETTIESAVLIFFDNSSSKGSKLCTFTLSSNDIEKDKSASDKYTLTTEVDANDLKQIFGKSLHLYVLANIRYDDLFVPSSGATDEDNFLASTFSNGSNKYFKSVGNQGQACPMVNYEYFTCDNFKEVYLSGSPSLGEIFTEFQRLINGSSEDTYTIPEVLTLERMIARVDYKAGSTTSPVSTNKNIYKLNDHAVNDNGYTSSSVYLKVNNLTLFNATTEAYAVRHTSQGSRAASSGVFSATGTASPFGIENGTDKNSYNWIASSHWRSTPSFINAYNENGINASSGKNTADEIVATTVANNDGFSPWFYLMENTVSSTADMNLSKCTGIEFETVLCNTDGSFYKTDNENDNLRITVSSGTDAGKYKVLTPVKGPDNKYYYTLKYKYLIPHDISTDSNVDGGSGKVSSLGPMRYGIVRNNVYQIELKGINNLPDPHDPDNFALNIRLKILPWAYHSIGIDW